MNPFPSGVGFCSNFSAVMIFSEDICFAQGTLGAETVVVTDVTVVVSTGAAVVVPTVVVDSVVVSGTGASVTVVVVVVVTVVVVSSTTMQATAETNLTSEGCAGLAETYVIFKALVSTGVTSGMTADFAPSGTD